MSDVKRKLAETEAETLMASCKELGINVKALAVYVDGYIRQAENPRKGLAYTATVLADGTLDWYESSYEMRVPRGRGPKARVFTREGESFASW